MTKSNRPKPMTAREKKWRADWRSDMREKGLISPVKKPLNRKKFIQEARDEFNKSDFGIDISYYLTKAIGCVMDDFHPTLESIGVAKVLKVACEIKRFSSELKEQGRSEYTVSELYERIKPILDA